MNYEDMVFVQSTTIIPVPDHIFHVYVGNLKFEPFVANPTNQDQSSIYILVALFEQASQIYYRHDMHSSPIQKFQINGIHENIGINNSLRCYWIYLLVSHLLNSEYLHEQKLQHFD